MVPVPISGFAPSAVSSPSRSDVSSTILFDTSKSNQFGVNDGLRSIQRLLKNRWRLANTKDRLNIESLSSSRLAILAGPQERYNEAEFNALRQFIDLGGNLLVLLGEDAVISTMYQKYFHPKECFIEEVQSWMANSTSPTAEATSSVQLGYEFGAEDLRIVSASRCQARNFKIDSAAIRNSAARFTSTLSFPLFRTLNAPPLELYDLDAEFSSEKNRLAQLTQLKLVGNNNAERAKQILHHVVERISQFKKSTPI